MIVGAGPAGSVLAQQLRCKGYRVALVDRQKFPRYAIGETLPASVGLLLKRARVVAPDFQLAGAPTTGNLSAWGDRRVTFHPHTADEAGRGFQVDRAVFDSQLLEAARIAGAEVFDGWRLEEFEPGVGGWQVSLRSPQGSARSLRTRFLCDASGRARVLARRLRLPQQQAAGSQIGLIGYWQAAHPESNGDGFNALVESLPDGWFYTAGLNPAQRVAGFMTDRSLLPSNLRRSGPQVYLEALQRTKHSQARLRKFAWNGQLKIFPTSPSFVACCCGPDWLLVGDAASTLDPLCSQGVQKAVASALTSTTAVHTLLVHPDRSEWVMKFLREREEAGFRSHLAARTSYYRRESRFATMPFWTQRAASETSPELEKRSDSGSKALRRRDRVTAGPAVEMQPRPVIEGEFVELRPVVIAPLARRGLRYCGDICVPDLIGLLSDQPTVDLLFSRYQLLHGDISGATFSTGIASLLEMGVLQKAG